MTICRLYPYTTGTHFSTELMNASHSTNLFTNLCDHIFTIGKAPLYSHINHNTPQCLYSLWRRVNAPNLSFLNLLRWYFNLYQLAWYNQTKFLFYLSHRRSTTVSLETRNPFWILCLYFPSSMLHLSSLFFSKMPSLSPKSHSNARLLPCYFGHQWAGSLSDWRSSIIWPVICIKKAYL